MDVITRPDETLTEVNEHIRLIQKKKGLAFGTDAFLLAAFARPAKGARAADFGCGTGIISLLLAAKEKYGTVYAAEVQEDFADLTRRNIALNGFSDTVLPLSLDLRNATPAAFGGELDAVLANPPYMKTDCGFASPTKGKQIARHEVMGGIAEFAAAAARCLKYGGSFYTVYRPDRLESLFAALAAARLSPKRMLFVQDAEDKPPSMVLTEARRGGKEGLLLLPTLTLRTGAENGAPLTPRAAQIYEECAIS